MAQAEKAACNRVNEYTCSGKRVYKNNVNRTGSCLKRHKILRGAFKSRYLLCISLEGDKAFIYGLPDMNILVRIDPMLAQTRLK